MFGCPLFWQGGVAKPRGRMARWGVSRGGRNVLGRLRCQGANRSGQRQRVVTVHRVADQVSGTRRVPCVVWRTRKQRHTACAGYFSGCERLPRGQATAQFALLDMRIYSRRARGVQGNILSQWVPLVPPRGRVMCRRIFSNNYDPSVGLCTAPRKRGDLSRCGLRGIVAQIH